MKHDLIRGGKLVTATETYTADIGIKDGRIATLGEFRRKDIINADSNAGRIEPITI